MYVNNKCVTELVIPEGVSEISNYAFYNCDSITYVTIPVSVVTINDNVFYNCKNLASINYKGSQSEWEKVVVGASNPSLTGATVVYNYTAE